LNLLDAIVLGIVQGLTEFLPVSSSAHVQIAEGLLGLQNADKASLTAFIATIQLGTEAAVLLYFWRDIFRIIGGWMTGLTNRTKRSNHDYKLGWLIIIGSIPVVVVGLAMQKLIENQFRSLWVAAFTLIAFGFLLGWADRAGKRVKDLDQITYRDGLLYGIGQAFAVVPGVSRSGATISVGLALGYTRKAATRYSFLLAIPAVLASGLLEFVKSVGDLPASDVVATGVATLVSFVIGYTVIAGLLRYLDRGSYMPFVIWRVVVGLSLIVALSSNFLAS
jgi:undecaprenyl-diphosphatase